MSTIVTPTVKQSISIIQKQVAACTARSANTYEMTVIGSGSASVTNSSLKQGSYVSTDCISKTKIDTGTAIRIKSTFAQFSKKAKKGKAIDVLKLSDRLSANVIGHVYQGCVSTASNTVKAVFNATAADRMGSIRGFNVDQFTAAISTCVQNDKSTSRLVQELSVLLEQRAIEKVLGFFDFKVSILAILLLVAVIVLLILGSLPFIQIALVILLGLAVIIGTYLAGAYYYQMWPFEFKAPDTRKAPAHKYVIPSDMLDIVVPSIKAYQCSRYSNTKTPPEFKQYWANIKDVVFWYLSKESLSESADNIIESNYDHLKAWKSPNQAQIDAFILS